MSRPPIALPARCITFQLRTATARECGRRGPTPAIEVHANFLHPRAYLTRSRRVWPSHDQGAQATRSWLTVSTCSAQSSRATSVMCDAQRHRRRSTGPRNGDSGSYLPLRRMSRKRTSRLPPPPAVFDKIGCAVSSYTALNRRKALKLEKTNTCVKRTP
jgi:hypothetical protein